MNETVYITGHKNPDTDSVCASIAYAELKKRFGVPAAAMRVGKMNRETEFVLRYFGVQPPACLTTVKTQVSDLNIDIINPVSVNISIKTAWSIMQKNNRRVLPVADENGKLLGIITLSDITKSYMNALENNILSASDTPLSNISETLKAKVVCGDSRTFSSAGKVVIASMAPDSLEPYIEKGDIVIIGNRKDSQLKVLEAGASCMISTCGGRVEKDVLDLARKMNCIVMETAYDTFTTARLINQSIPVGFIMTRKSLVCFNVNDFIDSIREKMLQTRYRSYPVVNDGGLIRGFVSRYHLISPRKKKIILLDHNERSQTVDGIDEADILEIIDHHRIGDIQTGYPIYFKNDTVGSTSTLIANMYFENGVRPCREIAGILCAAILSDTLDFKSPTSTYTDRETASRLAEIAEIDTDEFAAQMFRAGSALDEMSPEELLHYDFKDYNLSKYKIGIGQVNSSDVSLIRDSKDKLLAYMKKVLAASGYSHLLLMITDVIREGSYVLFTGSDDELMRSAFKTESGENSVYLAGVVSRKKQIVPLLTEAIQNLRSYQE